MFYKFQPVVTTGPDGTVIGFVNTSENDIQLIGEVDGWHWCWAPDDVEIPTQDPEINWQSVAAITETEKDQLKSVSTLCRAVSTQIQEKIRERYSMEDEQYFSRIGIGVALGAYQFQPDEQEALLAFGEYVESVRVWGREQRAKIGL